jgi:hypothetical protein
VKRVVTSELLDHDLGTAQEIKDSLRDLRGINQHLGGFKSVAAMLGTVANLRCENALTFLDVAGGTGDVAAQAAQDLLNAGIRIIPTVLDRAVSHMNGQRGCLHKVSGDALQLPFASSSFDVVGSNLFTHHLEPDELGSFLRESLRVSRLAVIASDLRRNWFHWVAACAGRAIYRSRLTRNDAPASVRRAYTIAEILTGARLSGAAAYEVRRYYFQRFGLILWKSMP